MALLKYLLTGAAVAAGYHYTTKKRADGTSLADEWRNKASEWMEQAKPHIDRLKGQFDNVSFIKGGTANQPGYPEKFDNFSPDPDPTYSS
jgi:hypothetical protein